MSNSSRLVSLALVLGFVTLGQAAEGPSAPATARSPANSSARASARVPPGVQAIRDIQYIPGGDTAQCLDLFLPDPPAKAPLPLLVWIHGGGWAAGSKDDCPTMHMVPNGYAAASVEYRFSQKAKFPAQIQDCQAAIRWLRANAARYNIDPNKIGVMGASAGGHLVALLGTAGGKNAFTPIGDNQDQSDRVQAVCDLFGPADFTTVMSQAAADSNVKNIFAFNTPSDPYSSLIGTNLENQDKSTAASPVHYVSSDLPPFLILHGTADALVPFAQSQELEAALKKAGVPVLLQVFPNAGHGGPPFGKPEAQQLIQTFFAKYLKGAAVELHAVPPAALTAEPANRQ